MTMQDSLEDYVRISKNKKAEAPPEVSPQLLITAQRKKECEARAMKIVEFLIEGKLTKEAFFECLKHINPSYYQDIVEERAITELCGYCLCNNRIPPMPKKQYHISTKSNKIYDITDRKNYCSNICYKSSTHIKTQIESSPLWLRKPDDVPKFNLLPADQKGVPGEEIDQGIVKPVKDETVFTSVSFFTEASLHEVVEDEIKVKKKKLEQNAMATITEDDEQSENDHKQTELKSNSNENDHKRAKLGSNLHEAANVSVVELDSNLYEAANVSVAELDSNLYEAANVSVAELDSNLYEAANVSVVTPNEPKKQTKAVDVLAKIKRHLNQWITLETFIYLHGENKIKSILNEKTVSDYFEKLKIADLEASQQIRYMNICKRLKLREIADEKFDKSVNDWKLRPIPDFQQLKEQSKGMDLKVRAFYSGALHEEADRNFPTPETNDETSADETVLPLINTNSHNVVRKKIYLDCVNKTLQKLLPPLDLNERYVFDEVRTLVKTFSLRADNTVLKPLYWMVVVVVLLKILSVKNATLRRKLQEKQSEDFIKRLLKPFPNSENFLEDIIKTLNDPEAFIERYITTSDE